ncbi:hypothetical protein L6252_03020 [Candidatus Parcubacteria bacterium]|nr:hypothetical protein [Candidatus Parcubacteria bacterium]
MEIPIVTLSFEPKFLEGGQTFQIETQAHKKVENFGSRAAFIFSNDLIQPSLFFEVHSFVHATMAVAEVWPSASLMSPVFELTEEGKQKADEWIRALKDEFMGAEGRAQQVVRSLPPTQIVPLLFEYIRAEEGRKYLVFKKSSNFQNLIVEIECEPTVEFVSGELVLRFKASVGIFCHSRFQQEEVEEIKIARALALSTKKDSPFFETAIKAMEWGSELAKEMKAAADRAKFLPALTV